MFFMPLPRWLARINRRVFNKMELKKGVRPVLIHVGRTSGATYFTPLDAHAVDGGYVFILMYGPGSDWAQNVLAAGTATLRLPSGEIPLDAPRLVSKDDVWPDMPETAKAPPGILNVTGYLRMDIHR